jgi:hypothetical protein
MAKVDTEKYVMIQAIVESTTPETADYKPYRTTLTFGGKLVIEVPVPASEVRQEKGGVTILTLEGWKFFLKNYTAMTEKLHSEFLHSFKN